MDVVGRYVGNVLLYLLLIGVGMFFSSSEVAIASISHGRVKKLCDEGNDDAKRLLKQKERQPDFSSYTSMSVALCILACTLILTNLLSEPMLMLIDRIVALCNDMRVDMIQTSQTMFLVARAISLILASFFTIMLGVTLPRKLVVKSRETFALKAVRILPFLSIVFTPLTYLPIKLTNGISRLLGVNPKIDLTGITEDEIRMLIEAGNQSGSIELSECEMINNIFEFDDRTAGEVMTHRTDLCAVNINQPLGDVINAAIAEGFSRIPVFEDDIDNIVGTIYAKDLLVFTGSDRDISSANIKDYLREVIFAPESARCRMLFREFKDKKTHMAIIVDEYGGTAGIVTMEDLLESIVGNIQDEYDEEQDEVEMIDENTYILDGGIDIEKLCKLMQIELAFDQHTETLGGLITNELGFIPEDTNVPIVSIGGVEFHVLQVYERRIQRVKAVRIV